MAMQTMNGTSYDERASKKLMEALEGARNRKERVRVFYGDVEGENSGRDWMEEHDTMGYIGRSFGSCQVPILLHNMNSASGGAMLTGCIVKLTTTKGKVLYQHPDYHQPELFVFEEETPLISNGQLLRYRVQTEHDVLARFHSEAQAERWAEFIRGNRNSK